MPGKIVAAPGRELQLEQLVARAGPDAALDQPGGEQRLRLGGEGEPALDLRGVERLDAERVAGEGDRALGPLVDGDGVHAAQRAGIGGAVAQPEMQRRLAVAVGGEADVGQVVAQLAVVVDLAVRDEGGGAGEERLVAAGHVDDGQARVHEGDAADDRVPGAVRAAMGERAGEGGEHGGVGQRRGGREHEASDAAHQRCRHRRAGRPASGAARALRRTPPRIGAAGGGEAGGKIAVVEHGADRGGEADGVLGRNQEAGAAGVDQLHAARRRRRRPRGGEAEKASITTLPSGSMPARADQHVAGGEEGGLVVAPAGQAGAGRRRRARGRAVRGRGAPAPRRR